MSDTLSLEVSELTSGWESRVVEFIRQSLDRGGRVVLSSETPTLTPQEFAEHLQISRSTVMRRIGEGAIAASRRGNRYRIPKSEVERFRALYVRELAASFAEDF
ncbi:helix-turn-helix domain-containing protein [Leucobacter insecticola]|uniref:Helix-turn-helix domain-containing protein n=2 Tax=Leucobacter insecticola TaxID=2714934 RepID=A0A6G8FH32_9MICO|nr:helix-turn-helix domain-containing protein [Leucobacter insecticola]